MLKLRYYQKEAIDAFFDYNLNNHGKHPLIVIPTAGGKSFIIAKIIEKLLEYENTRVLILTHSKQLISQNSEEFLNLFPDKFLDVGIYSAGLKRKDRHNRVIFGGIQSVWKKAWTDLGWFDLILVDEAHRISEKSEGMYRYFFDDMFKMNSNIVISGLTATAFRTKGGLLCDPMHENKLFDDICYETTIPELINPNHIKNKDNKQYLCSLISPTKSMKNKVDLTNVHILAGEYNLKEMEAAFNKNDLVNKTIQEILLYAVDRKKILIFTAGIDHCESIYNRFLELGLSVDRVHSKRSTEENDLALEKFRNHEIRFLLNVNSLTEGYNQKDIDCIVLLRSTKSPGLLIQVAGRGFRMHESKKDTLFLDFGTNIERFGPIDKIEIITKKDGTKEIQSAPQKECPECHSLIHLSIMECPDCGYLFPQNDKHEEKASEADIISKWKKPKEIEVSEVYYNRHSKAEKPDSLRVDYYYGIMDKYSTWVCLEHEGFARKKALQWLRNVTEYEIDTVEEALAHCESFRKPSKIVVDLNEKYPKITGYVFEEKEDEEDDIDKEEALMRLMF